MVFEEFSLENKKYFLLKFTKELIKASSKESFFELKTILNKNQEEKQEKIEKPLTNLQTTKNRHIKVNPFPIIEKVKKIEKPPKLIKKPIKRLVIPEYKLPPTFQYLRPVFTKTDIDLGKLNPLIKDPMIREIQCNGPGKNIIVRGSMGEKNSNIILTKEEIDFILDTFSKKARIPVHEGVTKIIVGNLVLSAVISKVIESKFIIKKMLPEPSGRRRIYGR